MIIQWLVSEFQDIFSKNPPLRIILWYDAKGEYTRLLDTNLFPPKNVSFSLLRYRLDAQEQIYHGPLWLKSQMVWETRHLSPADRAAQRYILYLPFARETLDADTPEAAALECLLEYKYAGKPWLIDGKEPTLFQFLRKYSVPLPNTQKEQRELWDGGRDSLLAKLVAQCADKDAAFWKQPLNAPKVQALITGDVEQTLLAVLADPDNAVADLRDRDALNEFVQAIAHTYAYNVPLGNDPRAWVEGFTIRLSLNECYHGYGDPNDFPYIALLPDPNYRQAWLAFWKRWVSDRDLSSVYNDLIRVLEPAYDLTAWAQGRVGSSQAFAHLAEAQWETEFKCFLAVAGSCSQLETYAQTESAQLKLAASGYWAKVTQDIPGWELLSDLCALITQSREAIVQSQTLLTSEDFVAAYADRWHRVDATYWRIFNGVRRKLGMEMILHAADLYYSYFLEEINGRFVQKIAAGSPEQNWGKRDLRSAVSALWSSREKTAILIVDALRYDLAVSLAAGIKGAQTNLEAWVTTIPTITDVGMTAMLPLGADGVSAILSVGNLELAHPQFGDLTIKAKRRTLLASKTGATFLELPDLLTQAQLPNTKFL